MFFLKKYSFKGFLFLSCFFLFLKCVPFFLNVLLVLLVVRCVCFCCCFFGKVWDLLR